MRFKRGQNKDLEITNKSLKVCSNIEMNQMNTNKDEVSLIV